MKRVREAGLKSLGRAPSLTAQYAVGEVVGVWQKFPKADAQESTVSGRDVPKAASCMPSKGPCLPFREGRFKV